MTPKSFDGYSASIHPPYDSITPLNSTRYRLIQQYQTRAVWDISLPDAREFLGQIEWFKRTQTYRIIKIERTPVTLRQQYQTWEEAAIALHHLAHSQAVA